MSQLFVTDGLTRAVLRPAAWVTLVDEPRLFECVPLRIPHIDFSGNAILIRGGMGAGGRITVYLRSSKTPLQKPLKKVKITMIYTYVGSRGPPRIRDLLNRLTVSLCSLRQWKKIPAEHSQRDGVAEAVVEPRNWRYSLTQNQTACAHCLTLAA